MAFSDPYTYTTTTANTFMWNGPSCPTCGKCYRNSHTCAPEDLQRKIDWLQGEINRLRSTPAARPYVCPCRTTGGTCNCIHGGMQVIC